MSSQSDQNNQVRSIASAPGDLPFEALEERLAKKASQFRHDNTLNPTAPKPDQPVVVTATSGAAMNIVRAELWYTTDGSWPDQNSHRLPMTVTDVEWAPHTRFVNHWQTVIPGQPDGTVVRYKIAGYADGGHENPDYIAHDGTGIWFYIGESGITTFAYRVRQEPKTLPDWMVDTVMYQIFMDRFHPGTADGAFPIDLGPHERHGGTIQGVLQSLPYISDLGYNAIWLSPIGPSATYHRYDQTDFFGIDPELGTEEELRELVDTAHKMGIRMILDFVPSHCSWEMPEFVAARQDQNAPSYDWFVFDEWPDKYRSFLNQTPMLPSFNFESEGARRYLIDSALYWLCDIGFDGLRLDHSIGLGMDFLVEFSNALEAAKPDVALFGEATDTPENLRSLHGRLQAFLDFPLAQALRLSFGRRYWGVKELAGTMQATYRFMQSGPGRVTFFDNHDINRLLFLAGDDTRRLKLAALCLMTLPFPPIIYYGTEIGMSQNQDKNQAGYGGEFEVRHDMIWDEARWDSDLHAFFKALIAFRHDHAVLRHGEWQLTLVEPEKEVFGYKMVADSAELLILINLNDTPQRVSIEGIETAENLFSVNGETLAISTPTGLNFTLPEQGSGVFQLR